MDWTKTTARRDENNLSFGIWCGLYYRFYGMYFVQKTTRIHCRTCWHFGYQPKYVRYISRSTTGHRFLHIAFALRHEKACVSPIISAIWMRACPFPSQKMLYYVKKGKLMLTCHGPLTRYVKLRDAHAPGMTGTFYPPPTSKETAS